MCTPQLRQPLVGSIGLNPIPSELTVDSCGFAENIRHVIRYDKQMLAGAPNMLVPSGRNQRRTAEDHTHSVNYVRCCSTATE
jgi:hypothetical protein